MLGEVVHREIWHWIQSYQRESPFTLAEVIETTWQIFLKRFQFSRQERYLFHPATDPFYTVLFEHVYGNWTGRKVMVERSLGQLYAMIKKAFRNLSTWKGFQRLQVLDPSRILYRDELLEADFLRIPLWIKIDLGYRELNGQVVLIDWKLSRRPEKKDLLQMAVYGTFARKDVCPTNSIRLIVYYLLEGRAQEWFLEPPLEQMTRGFIQRSFNKMSDFHARVKRGMGLKDLPPGYQKETCDYCHFRKLCFPGGIPRMGQPQTLDFRRAEISRSKERGNGLEP